MEGNMDKEVWKAIPGYEGFYEASTHGRIRSVDRTAIGRWGNEIFVKSHILRCNNVHNGYQQVKFCINGVREQPSVHRLVAKTFIPNPRNLPQVNHKDGNPSNNCIDNLEWCTASENAKHRCHVLRHFGGRKARKVLCIDTGVIYENSHHASLELGVNEMNIYRVCRGKGRTAGGLKFKYVS